MHSYTRTGAARSHPPAPDPVRSASSPRVRPTYPFPPGTLHLALGPAFRFVGLDRVGDGGELALFLGSFEATLEGICPLHQRAMHGVGFGERRLLRRHCWRQRLKYRDAIESAAAYHTERILSLINSRPRSPTVEEITRVLR